MTIWILYFDTFYYHPAYSTENICSCNQVTTRNMFHRMENGTAMMSGLFAMNANRLAAQYKFSYPIGEFHTVMVFPKPQVTNLQWVLRIFDVFQLSTYLLLFGSAFILLFFLTMIDVGFYGYRNPIASLSQFQSIQKAMKAARSPLVLAFNFLIIISVGLYQSLLLTRLFLHPTPEVMNSEKFLHHLEDKSLTLLFQNTNEHAFEQIMYNRMPFFARIRATLPKNPYYIQSNWSKVSYMMESGRFVTFLDEIPVSTFSSVYTVIQTLSVEKCTFV